MKELCMCVYNYTERQTERERLIEREIDRERERERERERGGGGKERYVRVYKSIKLSPTRGLNLACSHLVDVHLKSPLTDLPTIICPVYKKINLIHFLCNLRISMDKS